MTTEQRTTCPYCGVGCGVVVRDGVVRGDADHPSSLGRLCSKGAALGETLDPRGRLHAARIAGREAPLEAALDLVAERFGRAIAAGGPDRVGFYLSGQLLTEDYYVANKLMKGFIGGGNIDTNSRLCMSSTVAGHKRGFGADIVPGTYDDFDAFDLATLVGANTAWCHPVLHQRLLAARAARGGRIVVLDPRRTQTADGADLHLALAPDSDVALFAGLLVHLDERGAIDRAWCDAHAGGLDAALARARDGAATRDEVAAATGLDQAAIGRFYDLFARTDRALTLFSQGVNQSVSGTDKVNAIINVHLATGRIGRPGTGPFSLTGQPNAMGGREVGGLTNLLAAHMDFSNADRDRVGRFWRAPNLVAAPGLRAVELFDAVGDGRIDALWIAATNPAATMPRAERVRAALRACPFVVVSDAWDTDTTALADVVLPAAAWGEKDGTVTNSERRISRQRPFRAAPGDARPDWRLFADVATRLGFGPDFAWPNSAAVFREHAALTAFENDGTRLLDLGALAAMTDAEYAAMPPTRWPRPAGAPAEGGRLFADGRFPTEDGRARIVAVSPGPRAAPAPDGFVLNTGRVRDQWHTMTRTGLVPRLMAHVPDPTLAMHPDDALALGLFPGDPAELATAHGRMVLPVATDDAQRPGEVFVPMHWTDMYSSSGPVGRLAQAERDPHSGQPGLKATRARVTPMLAFWHGVLLVAGAPEAPRAPAAIAALWSRQTLDAGTLYRLTGLDPLPADGEDALAALLPDPDLADPDIERVAVSDRARNTLRVALLADGVLLAFLAVGASRDDLPPTDWLAGMLGETVPEALRLALHVGRPPGGAAHAGATVCACYAVTAPQLRRAILAGDLDTADAVGRATRAGTNCRSCVPEIEALLRDVRLPA